MPNDETIYIVRVPQASSASTSDVSNVEWTAMGARVTALENDPRLLTDLDDVDANGITDGDTLVYDADSDTFLPGTAGGTIAEILDHSATVIANDVSRIVFRLGLTASWSSVLGRVHVEPIYGTTVNTVAAGNHQHTQFVDWTFPISASGTLSGGTRSLVSGNVTGLTPANSYILTGHLMQDLRGEGSGAGRTGPYITIDGDVKVRPHVRTVAGVDREYTWTHTGVLVTGKSSVSVSASLQFAPDGLPSDPVNVGAGMLSISIKPYR